MMEVSKKTKLTALIYISLWLIGSAILFHEKNGRVVILLTAVVIILRLKAQIQNDRKQSENSPQAKAGEE